MKSLEKTARVLAASSLLSLGSFAIYKQTESTINGKEVSLSKSVEKVEQFIDCQSDILHPLGQTPSIHEVIMVTTNNSPGEQNDKFNYFIESSINGKLIASNGKSCDGTVTDDTKLYLTYGDIGEDLVASTDITLKNKGLVDNKNTTTLSGTFEYQNVCKDAAKLGENYLKLIGYNFRSYSEKGVGDDHETINFQNERVECKEAVTVN